MFDTAGIKNYKRQKSMRLPSMSDKLFESHPGERTLPFFDVVPEQVLSDAGYQSLSRQDQGDFWRLVLLLWPERCRFPRHPGIISEYLGMSSAEWEVLEARLIAAGLLMVSPNQHYILQPELREQYLQTLTANNNKRRVLKS
jgi:hypothetical protein